MDFDDRTKIAFGSRVTVNSQSMAKKSKFKAGDRVWFTHAGDRFRQEGTVTHVRKDGALVVNFDADPSGPSSRMRQDAILVVQPYEVDPIGTKKAYEARHHATKKSPVQLQREIDEVLARSQDVTRTPYEEAKAEGALLEQEVDAADALLKAFPRSPLGGTTDAARATPEFRAAHSRFQRAFAALRAFNAVFTKRFAKEIRAERAERYSRLAKP